MLATVIWDGGPTGNGTTFHEPSNWVGDILPASGDTAQIGHTGNNPPVGINAHVTSLFVNTVRNLTLYTGTISNSTITASDGATATATGGTLSNVTLAMDVLVPAQSMLSINFGLTLVGGAAITGAPGAELFCGTSEVIGGYGSIILDNCTFSIGNPTTATVTIGEDVAVEGRGEIRKASWFPNGNVALVNHGSIVANVNLRSLVIFGFDSFTNGGALIATDAGTISVEDSSITPGGLGQFDASAGTVQLGPGAVLNNDVTTLALSGPGQTLTFAGGMVLGGIIIAEDGASLLVSGDDSRYGTLSGVTLGADVLVLNGNSLNLQDGLTLLDAVITLNATTSDTYLKVLPGTQTIAGAGSIVLDGASSRNQLLIGEGGATTLTIGADVRITGRGLLRASAFGSSLVNGGVIESNVVGQLLGIATRSFTNYGSLVASNDSRIVFGNAIIPPGGLGDIDASDGTIELGVNSQLHNDGTVLSLNSPGRILTITGGLITGGTVSATEGGALLVKSLGFYPPYPILRNVTLDADVTIPNGLTLQIEESLTLVGGATITIDSTGAHTELGLIFDATVHGTGYIVLAGNGATQSNLNVGAIVGTATIGPSITVRGWGTISGHRLVNQGTIEANGSNLAFRSLQGFTNAGTLIATNGGSVRFDRDPENLNAGTLNGGNWVVGPNSYIYSETAAQVVTNNANVEIGGSAHGAHLWSALATNNGSLTFGVNFSTAGSLVNNGTLTVAGATLNVAGSLEGTGMLIETENSTIAANRIRQHTVTNNGLLLIRPSGTDASSTIVRSLSMGPTGTLDLNDNDLIVDYSTDSPLGTIQSLISSGRSGGSWKGSGITSSTARNAANSNTTLGALEASDYTSVTGLATFSGQPLDSTMRTSEKPPGQRE